MNQTLQSRPSRRWEKGAWVAFVFATLVFLYTLGNFIYYASLPVDGTIAAEQPLPDGSGQIGIFVITSAGDSTGILQPGDQILAVNGVPVSEIIANSLIPFQPSPQEWDPQEELIYSIQRGTEQFEARMKLHLPDLLAQWLAIIRTNLASGLFQTLSSLAFFVIGLSVFFLRPNERAAHALMIVGVAFLGNALPTYPSMPWYLYSSPPVIRWDSWDGAINPSLLYLLLAFPRPIWPLRRYPRLTVVFLYGWVPFLLQAAFLLNLGNYGRFVQAQMVIIGISLLPLFAVVLVMLRSLFTERDPVALAQLKWLAAGMVGFVVIGIGGWAAGFYLKLDFGSWVGVLGQLGWLLMPICLAIAITRTRLFDIDIIIRRTLQYGLLTLLLGLVYFGMVTLLQALFAGLSQQQSPLTIVLSTLVIAALFTPLRWRLQAAVDRRFYRRKYNAEQAVAAFSAAAAQ